MKLKYSYGILFLLLSCIFAYGQTGINTFEVSPNSALHIEAKDGHQGLLVPQLTRAQRDAIAVSTLEDDGLIIYNTEEECINYWSALEREWKSACGQVGKAAFHLTSAPVVVKGQYLNNTPLDGENYIVVSIEVTKAGRLGLSATSSPDNGYYFYFSSDYVGVGRLELKLPAMGIPTNYGTDTFRFIVGGEVGGNHQTFTVEVENADIQPAYTMACEATAVVGVYKMDEALTGGQHQLKVKLTAAPTAAGATYILKTEEVDGISFEGEGKLVGGEQVVTLKGKGVPYTTEDKRLRIRSNSSATGAVCYATVRIVSDQQKIITFGGGSDQASIGNPTSAVRRMLEASENYGVAENSKVAFEGWEGITNGGATFNATNIINAFELAKPHVYDIIVLEKGITTFTAAAAEALVRYLQRGGVVLMFNETPAVVNMIFAALSSSSDVSGSTVHKAGALYRFSNENDLVLNGAFGDIRGQYWGEDNGPSLRLTNIVGSDYVVYSEATDASIPIADLPSEQEPGEGSEPGNSSSPEVGNQGTEGVTALRHGSYAFVWVGDGGFNNAANASSATNSPFKLMNNTPVAKEDYGHTTKRPASNAIFTANLFEWAIKHAQNKGVNRKVN